MERQFTRTTTAKEQRGKGGNFERDVKGFRENRFEKVADAKVDDIGVHPDLRLRETDDRAAMIAAMRADVAQRYGFTIIERPEAQSAEVYEEPVAPAISETLEKLSAVERVCLESMKKDFNRGIVCIDDNADKDAYQAALKQDKTAGRSWETVQRRLVDNGEATALLKKAVALSELTGNQEGKGALLVGVYENGELAIRQRSSEIVNAIVNKDGQLRLAYHPEAELEEGEQWAKAVEIVRAVKAAGYHVSADAPDYNKKGLVAASEAVTGADYVASPNRNEWRSTMLECPDDVSDNANVRVVVFFPFSGRAGVDADRAYRRLGSRGAVLWLRG